MAVKKTNGFAAGTTVHTQVGDFIAGSDVYNKYVAQTGDTGWQSSTPTASVNGGTTQPSTAQPTTYGQAAQQTQPLGTYNFATEAGKKLYDQVDATGQQVIVPDGHKGTILSKGPDGKLYVFQDGIKMNAQVTYQTEAQKREQETADFLAAWYAMNSGQNSAYQQALAQQQAANNLAVQKAVGDLQTQKQSTDNSYANLFRQLYINKMNAKKNEDQKLAAQGITGGMAESNRLDLETSYAEALRQGEMQRLQTQTDLDKAITDTRLTGDIQNATAASEAAISGAKSYETMLQSLISRNDTLSAAGKQQAYDLAMQMLQQGEMPSQILLTDANIGRADAQSILNGFSKSKPTQLSAAIAVKAFKGGSRDAKVRQIIEDYYGMSAEQVLLGQPEEASGYTAEQAAMALLAAAAGKADETTKRMLESYYKMPLSSILAAYNAQKTYSTETVQAALTEALKGNVTEEIRSIVESAFSGLPLETVVNAYKQQ